MLQLAKLYNYLLNVSIVTRWSIFIIPVLALLWIPGILGLTKFHDATVRACSILAPCENETKRAF